MKNEIVGKFETFVLLLIILLLGVGARFYKIGNPIADWHSWRQADTASVTRIYSDSGINLLYPKYYDVSAIQTGYTNLSGLRFVEFPIFNLLHLFVYKTGLLNFTVSGRVTSILASTITSVALFFLGKKVGGKWVGILAAFFYSLLPFNIYFTRVILPEPLAAMFGTLGALFFVHYIDRNKLIFLYLSAIFFASGLLLKPFVVFYAFLCLSLAFKKYGVKKMMVNIPLLLFLDITLIPFILWRGWINYGANLVGAPFSSWLFNGDGIRFRPAFFRWIFAERLGILILGVWGLPAFVLGVMASLKKNIYVASLFIGMCMYFFVVATANVRHDYYQTLIIPIVALVLSYGYVEIFKSKEYRSFFGYMFVLFSIGMMFVYSWSRIKDFYQVNHYEIVVAGEEVDRIVPKEAKVIAPYNGDTAFLYHTRRFGWPIVDRSIDELISLGARYYVSVNFDKDTNEFMKKFETIKKTDKYVILDLTKKI